jgi:nucleotide-binding universal stress UspA family protein
MFKDILLTLPSFPRPASLPTLRKAVNIAAVLEAHLTCTVTEPRIPLPVAFHPYSEELEKRLNARQREAHQVALSQMTVFEEEARLAGIAHDGRVITAPDGGDIIDPIVDCARLFNLTIVPFLDDNDACADLVQALAFESGRPVLVLPENDEGPFKLDRVMVAWDGGRAAARAVADALPLLQRAAQVRVVTVSRDKQLPQTATGGELATHFARNGVNATLEEIEKNGRAVGQVLEDAASGADLVVMGAFGHSRIRDFFLGGATTHVLKAPKRPTLLSH